MRGLAGEIHSLLGARIRLGQIAWQRFADGFPNVFIEECGDLKRCHVIFLPSFHSPHVIFEQYAVASALPLALPKSFKVIVPWFPTGTMERVSKLGEVATANSLARILSSIPSCAKGPAQIVLFDIHALQNQFYFKDSVLVRLESCVPLLLNRLRQLSVSVGSINIAFPDDGAVKRFGDFFSSFASPVVCHKVRDGDRRVVKMKEGDVKGKYIVIVDDLVQSGGTLIECAKELLGNGAAKVSAYVTHAVFPNESWRKFVRSPGNESTALFDYFWCTNTNPTVTDCLSGHAPFEVLSIAPLLADICMEN